ncbi:MAG: alpha-ketoacid dehydrogenase subunit beta [Planctomycetes bacterium]|nr:alpha-ketoacid dehydrogenase subunit beta [Planctomycetota bacterium]
MKNMTMVQALNTALHEQMNADDSVLIMGQDVGVDEGVFRVTVGLLKKFGPKRVVDTPLAEAGIVGTAVGMALYGLRPVCEIQFSGFTYQAFHQIEQHAARFRNRTRGRLHTPMVIRTPYGGGIRAVEHHSESREVYYAHTPGLKVVIPSGPRSARALLNAAIRDPDTVIFYEPKAIYRAFREEVPDEPEVYEIGKAVIARPGSQITLIAYGAMMRPTLEAADELGEQHDIDAEVLDLVSISPIDTQSLTESVSKTGRAVVIHEAPRTCGVAAELIARINETAFAHLEAPIKRVTGYDIQFPYFQVERYYLPDADTILAAARETMRY